MAPGGLPGPPDSGSSKLKSAKQKWTQILDYLVQKYPAHFGPQFVDENIYRKFKNSPWGFTGKLFLKTFFPKAFDAKVREGALRKYI